MHSILASSETEASLLEVVGLSVAFGTGGAQRLVVDQISFALDREKLAIVGESGSGKSITARAIMRLLPAGASVVGGAIRFGGRDLLGLREREMCQVRGKRISLILQDPKYSLHPTMPVGDQIAEAWHRHKSGSRRSARKGALDLMEQVRISDPHRVFDLYPHQVSGGMGQRIMIAMALAGDPDLIIADEPTSALDVMVRQECLALLDGLVSARGMGLLLISHDLDMVRTFSDRVLVMYRGRIVERLRSGDVGEATHPYTRALLEAQPRPHKRGKMLAVIDRTAPWARSDAP